MIGTERIESLKAGGLAALAGLPVGVGLAWSHRWAGHPLAALAVPIAPPALLSGAIALVASFLFGITYRYVMRQDQNSHLKSGAVLAFGLVRGLAQIEGSIPQTAAPLPLIMIIGESLLLFTVAQWGLDRAIAQGWLQPLSGSCEGEFNDLAHSPNSTKSVAP